MTPEEIEIAKSGTGNCFEIHVEILVDMVKTKQDLKKYRLVHGSVYNEITGRHPHCWIEIDDKICRDMSNGLDVTMTKEDYYRIGQIQDVKKYTFKQMRLNLLRSGHYGQWNSNEDLFYDEKGDE